MSGLHSPLSERDLELLSAYLDGELAAPDRGALEQRLAREESLRATLDDLRTNQQLLRVLPLLKAPRSFALDPTVYGRRAAWRRRIPAFENAFQLAGALGAAASLLLVVAGLLIAGTGAERIAAPLAPTESPALEIALQPATETLAASAPMPTASPQALWAGTLSPQATVPAGTPIPPGSPPPENAPAAAQFAAPETDEDAAMLSAEAPAGAAPPLAPPAEGFAPGIMAAAPDNAAGGAVEESQLRDAAQEPLPSPAQQKLEAGPTPTEEPAQSGAVVGSARSGEDREAESVTATHQAEQPTAPSGEDQTGTALTLTGLAALVASAVLYLAGRRRARRA